MHIIAVVGRRMGRVFVMGWHWYVSGFGYWSKPI